MPRSLVPVAASDAKRVEARLAAAGQKVQALIEVDEENDEEKVDGGDKSGTMEGPGERALLAFMARCLPQKASGSVVEDWNAVQAAETPTLLPGLRFHDLVFGRQLGEGAFSTVRYARHIQRGGVSGGPSSSSQSQWPEYAVKIVSGAKMTELGYHASVEREMAVLHLLAHPGVCRLVSAFRYTGNAYMVLEYAARGDLHSFVLSLGGGGKRALGHAGARFVLGEVCAALQSVHELGFSFNDLKPENVLLTGLGHVKLADFGASRPLGSEGRRRLEDSLSRVGCLRNGDWREEGASAVGGVDSFPVLGRGASAAREEEEEVEEELAEGTPGYLPPEVLGLRAGTGEGYSSSPGLGADAWALGCLAWFCLTGRPLFYGSRDEVLTQQQDPDHCPALLLDPAAAVEEVEESEEKDQRRKVHFGAEADAAAESFLGDGNTGPFLRGLLNRDPRERLSVLDASNHAYLMQGPAVGDEDECQPLQPLRLHAGTPVALPLSSSSSSTSDDNPQWARRQFSVLWAPMPPVYDILAGQDQIQGQGQGQGHSRGAPRRYALTTVEETQAESGTFFL
jgi:serine/threonine protein kinase